jgi:hypothetical protein
MDNFLLAVAVVAVHNFKQLCILYYLFFNIPTVHENRGRGRRQTTNEMSPSSMTVQPVH